MADIGHNLNETKIKIAQAIKSIKELKLERSEVNASIAEVRATMEALGINKAAFDMAIKYLNWEPEKREGFDLAYAIVREAGGLPLSEDLFSAAERIEADKKKAAAEEAKKVDADAIKRKAEQEAEKVFDGSAAISGKPKAAAH
jgi:hypothetical protein